MKTSGFLCLAAFLILFSSCSVNSNIDSSAINGQSSAESSLNQSTLESSGSTGSTKGSFGASSKNSGSLNKSESSNTKSSATSQAGSSTSLNSGSSRIELKPFAKRIGITHAGEKYSFTSKPNLIEGAEEIYNQGFRVIKLWFDESYTQQYISNSNWPRVYNLLELAKTTYYKQVFDMPFDTFVLNAHSFGPKPFQNGLSSDERQSLYNDIYNLAKYLIDTYKGTGKTFVISNWEGDWYMADSYDINSVNFKDSVRQKGFTDWLNTRQDAINDARGSIKAMKEKNVFVFGCAELNFINPNKPDYIIDTVIPNTYMDLYSYSNYQTRTDPQMLRDYVKYIKDRAPDSEAFGNDNVVLGEFGTPENSGWEGGQYNQQLLTRIQIEICLNELKMPFVAYWQLYCNERLYGTGKATVEQMRGFGLIRADGSRTSNYYYFATLLGKINEATRNITERPALIASCDRNVWDIKAGWNNDGDGQYKEYYIDGSGKKVFYADRPSVMYGYRNRFARKNGDTASITYERYNEGKFRIEAVINKNVDANKIISLHFLDKNGNKINSDVSATSSLSSQNSYGWRKLVLTGSFTENAKYLVLTVNSQNGVKGTDVQIGEVILVK